MCSVRFFQSVVRDFAEMKNESCMDVCGAVFTAPSSRRRLHGARGASVGFRHGSIARAGAGLNQVLNVVVKGRLGGYHDGRLVQV